MKRARNSLVGAWFDLALGSMELMQGSATVITKRTAAMAGAANRPSAKHDREMKRMVDEKVVASAASLAGMAVSATTSWQSMFFASLLGGHAPSSTQAQRAMTKVLAAGMTPYRKAVRSNVKRLRK